MASIGMSIRTIIHRASRLARHLFKYGASPRKVLNLGSGRNPLAGAVNVDIRALKEVDVVGDASKLPFKNAVFDCIIVQNPYDWEPLRSNAARILKPGGTLTVVGQPRNPFIRGMMNKTPSELQVLGWELIEQASASEALKFGIPRASTGQILDSSVFIQLTYRRLQ
ncbi:methyltransferase domain-containing protein [Candidatus Poribacteria bacterium]|nr:methyltransferase domain-containing protein [Candidatus Poribacteria bacterium]